MLKEKHALEEQEELLREKKEQLELEAGIAATMAKVQMHGSSRRSSVLSDQSKRSDGMTSYFEREEKKALDVDAKSFVPHLPNTHPHGQSPSPQKITNPQIIKDPVIVHTAVTHTQPSTTDPRILN